MKDSGWISVEDRLPENNTYVLVYYNEIYNPWSDRDSDPHFVVAKFIRGLSKEDRKRTGERTICRADESGNNERPYIWDTFGTNTLLGQSVNYWMPLPAAPPEITKPETEKIYQKDENNRGGE